MTPEELQQAFEEAKAAGDFDAAFAIEKQLEAAQTGSKSALGYVSGLIQTAQQGLTLGFGDELSGVLAGIGALVPGGRSPKEAYTQQRDAVRSDVQQFAEQNPKTAFGAEMAGGLATGAAGGGRVLGAKALQKVPQITRTAGAGAAGGAVYGAGVAEDMESVPAEAGAGAAFGAAGGALALPIAKLAGKVGTWIEGAYGRLTRGPEARAVQRIAEAFAEDDIPLDQVRQRVSDLGEGATVMDAGRENVVGLVEGAANRPGPARRMAAQTLTERNRTIGGRVLDGVRKNLDSRMDNFQAEQKAIEKRMREAAKPLYKKAYETELNNGSAALQRLQQNPEIQAVSAKAQRNLLSDPDVPDYVKKAYDPDTPSLAYFDQVKRALDDRIGTAKRDGERDTVRRLTRIKNELVDELDKQVPAYKAARKVYSDDAGRIDALNRGLDTFTAGKNAVTVEEFRALPKDQQALFRLGAAQAAKNIVKRTKRNVDEALSASIFSRLLGDDATEEILREVFPSKQAFDAFEKMMKAERKFRVNSNTVMANSATARRIEQSKQDLAGEAYDAVQAAAGDAMAGTRLLAKLFGRNRPNKELDAEIVRNLADTDVAAIQAALDKIENAPGIVRRLKTLQPEQMRKYLSNPRNVRQLEAAIGSGSGAATVGATN